MTGLREVSVAIGLVALGALIAVLALNTIGPGVQTDPLGPRAMPVALGGGMALCGLLLLVGRAVRPAPRPALLAEGPSEIEDVGPFSPSRLLLVIVATAVYVAAFEPLGYLLATPPYVAALLLIHGAVPQRALLAAPVLVALALYAGFRLGLNVPLPGGILETLFPR
jgi:putative tricarboxylic transport membrane protein